MNECIWAPWRLPYIVSAKDQEPTECFLCAGRDSNDDRANLVVHRTPHSLAVLNRYPYNNGHSLIAPQSHKATFAELSDEEMLACLRTMERMIGVLDQVLHPHGYNIGVNLGKVAGAGLPGHFHWHVVPRWEGDTNFMPVLASVKVIPQALEQLHEQVVRTLASMAKDSASDGQ